MPSKADPPNAAPPSADPPSADPPSAAASPEAMLRPIHRPLCPDGSGAAAGDATAPCEPRARPFVLAAVTLASSMAFIDASVAHIALPAIQDDLNASFSGVQWVANAYALTLGGLILVGGGLGDRIGRRFVFIAGVVVFAVASLACALAPTAPFLILARAAQGLGAALLAPQSLAIIAAVYPRETRGRAIGLWAGASAAVTAFGPPLGGFLIDALDWRAAFWINLPLAAVTLWMALAFIPESRAPDAGGPLDWPGGLAATVGFGALTFGLSRLAETPDLGAALSVGVGAVGLAALVWIERRAANPVIPPALFSEPRFVGANLATLLLYGGFGAALFLLPFDLIARQGLSATEVGLTLLPLGLVIGLFSSAAGALADRVGPERLIAAGAAVVAIALAWLATAPAAPLGGALWAIILMAGGMALVVAPLTTLVMAAAPDALSGAASGVNNAASRLAGLFAVALAGAVAASVFSGALAAGSETMATGGPPRFGALPSADDPARPALEAAFSQAYATAMAVAAALAGLASLATLALAARRPAPA